MAYYLVAVGVLLLVVLVIRPAIARSQKASDLSQFQHHLATLQAPFTREPDETVSLALVARDLGAVRQIGAGGVTEDNYPRSFPLVYCTSKRLVVLMSTTDRPTAITGIYPVHQPNLHERIGEQFDDANGRFVSSASWHWETINKVVADGLDVGLGWSDREGVGVLLLKFVEYPDATRFVRQALVSIAESRRVAAIEPAEAQTETDGSTTDYTFAHALVSCGSCASEIAAGDQFCTGCGAAVTRLENA